MKNTSRILRTWKCSLDNPRICNEIMIKDVCCMVDVFLTQWLLCGYRKYPQNLRYLRIQDNEIWTLMMPHLTSNRKGGRVRKFFFWRGRGQEKGCLYRGIPTEILGYIAYIYSILYKYLHKNKIVP